MAGPAAGDTSASSVRFMILGPLRVEPDEGASVQIGQPLHRLVLATLILSADVRRTRSWLVQAVWGERPPADPASSLRTAVKSLRDCLGPLAGCLKSPEQGYTYAFSAEGVTVDASLFGDLANRALGAWYQGDVQRAADLLTAAERLWREPALADVPVTPALEDIRAGLLRRRADVESLRLDVRLKLGGHHEAIGDIRRVLARDPLREHASAQLMLALHRCGHDAEALRAFDRAQAALRKEYGADPGPELTELRQMIVSGSTVLRAAGAALARPPAGSRSEPLPAQQSCRPGSRPVSPVGDPVLTPAPDLLCVAGVLLCVADARVRVTRRIRLAMRGGQQVNNPLNGLEMLPGKPAGPRVQHHRARRVRALNHGVLSRERCRSRQAGQDEIECLLVRRYAVRPQGGRHEACLRGCLAAGEAEVDQGVLEVADHYPVGQGDCFSGLGLAGRPSSHGPVPGTAVRQRLADLPDPVQRVSDDALWTDRRLRHDL